MSSSPFIPLSLALTEKYATAVKHHLGGITDDVARDVVAKCYGFPSFQELEVFMEIEPMPTPWDQDVPDAEVLKRLQGHRKVYVQELKLAPEKAQALAQAVRLTAHPGRPAKRIVDAVAPVSPQRAPRLAQHPVQKPRRAREQAAQKMQARGQPTPGAPGSNGAGPRVVAARPQGQKSVAARPQGQKPGGPKPAGAPRPGGPRGGQRRQGQPRDGAAQSRARPIQGEGGEAPEIGNRLVDDEQFGNREPVVREPGNRQPGSRQPGARQPGSRAARGIQPGNQYPAAQRSGAGKKGGGGGGRPGSRGPRPSAAANPGNREGALRASAKAARPARGARVRRASPALPPALRDPDDFVYRAPRAPTNAPKIVIKVRRRVAVPTEG